MRRGLATACLILVVLGLELSTEVLSLMLARFGSGFQSIRAGVEFHVSPVRFGTGILALGLGVALWLLLIWSGQVKDAVSSVGNACPDCGNKTRRVKRKEWHKLLSFLLGQRLTKRKCEICGWNGLSMRL